MNWKNLIICILALCLTKELLGYNAQEQGSFAGPFSSAMQNLNQTVPDAAVAGFVGPNGLGVCPSGPNDEQPSSDDCNNYINPVFVSWANGYSDYIPSPAADPQYIQNEQYVPTGGVPATWRKPLSALGPVTGDNFDVCVLGDLWTAQLDLMDSIENQGLDFDDPNKIQPGQITLIFDQPFANHNGPDFVVFENGFISGGGAGVSGQIFAELAYVEVSSDGVNFARFPSVSLTDSAVGPYGTVDPSNVYNLAGKHVNAYQSSWGTPFNLDDLELNELVQSNVLDLENVKYVRIVDIPGSGYFEDEADLVIDPNTINDDVPSYFDQTHKIRDAWVTWGSGGFDLEAVGVISDDIAGDANLDGKVDLADFVALAFYWKTKGYWSCGDFNEDNLIDFNDLFILGENWLKDLRALQ